MKLYQELAAREILKQVTDPQLEAELEKGPTTLYCGFDPTADSLHVGSLLPLLTLRRFQKAGHRPIAVAGGATGMIGDPSGKSQERSLLGPDQLAKNVEGIRILLERFLDLKGPSAARVLNNADWFLPITFIDFLRDVGKHFTVNYMVAKESVRARLEDREHGISYTEFSYMLLQAYDFYWLKENHGCRLQIGGSDQWGNITAGIELIRRMGAHSGDAGSSVFGLTHPLVTQSNGTKFGKTESGTIWLDPNRTSPYRFYQFWLQTTDADAIRYLKYFSFRSLEEIELLAASLQSAPEKREAQTALATELTELVHGKDGLERARSASQALFGSSLGALDEATLKDVFSDAPHRELPLARLAGAGLSLVDVLAEVGLCPSKGVARKDVQGGGVSVNQVRVQDVALHLQEKDLLPGRVIVLRKGKKTFYVLKF